MDGGDRMTPPQAWLAAAPKAHASRLTLGLSRRRVVPPLGYKYIRTYFIPLQAGKIDIWYASSKQGPQPSL